MALPPFLVAVSLVASLISIVGHLRPWPPTLPRSLASLPNLQLDLDHDTAARFSTDFGRLVDAGPPAGVLRPSSSADIAALVSLSVSSPRPFSIAPRGHGHSVHGQAFAPGGVVVDMSSLGSGRGDRINISVPLRYVDAGGEQLWIDVLRATLRYGLAPRSWTDYLHLTVGGTLSNAGVSGQAFRYGPQIANVQELDVVTGTGEAVTCSPEESSELFHGVLGGLGQFGVITRARIGLEPAPRRVRWLRLIYAEFGAFKGDQELLVSLTEDGFDYVEGSLLTDHTLISSWRSSFFSGADAEKIKALAADSRAVYCLEAAAYYGGDAGGEATPVDQKVEALLGRLRYAPGFAFANDVSYVAFLDRVHDGEMKLREAGLWEVAHPWLNLFVPASRIGDFEAGVLRGILLRDNNSMGPVLVYPMNRDRWDERMSAVIPDEEVFYSVGLLRSAAAEEGRGGGSSAAAALAALEEQNEEILRVCREEGIEAKQYLPHYTAQGGWRRHFGAKWDKFVALKRRYDPKAILSPGQQIFTASTSLLDNYVHQYSQSPSSSSSSSSHDQ